MIGVSEKEKYGERDGGGGGEERVKDTKWKLILFFPSFLTFLTHKLLKAPIF